MTNFTIPNIGFNVGTCGWLAKGLADGSITIKPGLTKANPSGLQRPGLWLHAGNLQECLAIFNPFSLGPHELAGQQKIFEQVSDHEFGAGSMIPFTGACRGFLEQIASEWAEAQNEAREADDDAPLKALSITIAA